MASKPTMQHQLFAQHADAERLILFFNGWAMTPESVTHLSLPPGHDLAVVWDYRDDHLELDCSRYEGISLVAWSMGVWAADRLSAQLSQLPLERGIALCGTGRPMDDLHGIPVEIFAGTLAGLNEANRKRFNRRMCGGKTYAHLLKALECRSTEEIRQELERVQTLELAEEQHSPASPLWTKAWVAGEDRIFPAANQLRYWQGAGVETSYEAEAAHYLMGGKTCWQELW